MKRSDFFEPASATVMVAFAVEMGTAFHKVFFMAVLALTMLAFHPHHRPARLPSETDASTSIMAAAAMDRDSLSTTVRAPLSFVRSIAQ